jgi:hypothetical protein
MSRNDGDEFQAECAHMLMKCIYTPACHPSCHPAANGAVGRLVWSVEDILRKYIKAHLQYWVSQEAPSLHGSYAALAFSSGGNLPIKHDMSALTWLCQLGSNISCLMLLVLLKLKSVSRVNSRVCSRPLRGWMLRPCTHLDLVITCIIVSVAMLEARVWGGHLGTIHLWGTLVWVLDDSPPTCTACQGEKLPLDALSPE